jgi:hypothetical protein
MATAGDREGCQGKTQTALVFGPTFVEGASQLSLIQLPQDILKKVPAQICTLARARLPPDAGSG